MNRIIMPDVYNYAVVLIKGIDDYKFIYIGAIISIFIAVIKYNVFYIRNKKRIGIGLDIQYFSRKEDKIFTIIASICSVVCVTLHYCIGMCGISRELVIVSMCMCAMMVILIYLSVTLVNKIRFDKLKLSRTFNKVFIIGTSIVFAGLGTFVLIVFTANVLIRFNIPSSNNSVKVKYYNSETKSYEEEEIEQSKIKLTRKDLGYVDKNEKYIESILEENSKSLFGEYYSAQEEGYYNNGESGKMSLSYKYVKSDYKFILDSFADSYIKYNEYKPYKELDVEATKKWRANKVYKITL